MPSFPTPTMKKCSFFFLFFFQFDLRYLKSKIGTNAHQVRLVNLINIIDRKNGRSGKKKNFFCIDVEKMFETESGSCKNVLIHNGQTMVFDRKQKRNHDSNSDNNMEYKRNIFRKMIVKLIESFAFCIHNRGIV